MPGGDKVLPQAACVLPAQAATHTFLPEAGRASPGGRPAFFMPDTTPRTSQEEGSQ